MSPQELNNISNKIENREFLEEVYTKLLCPLLLDASKLKKKHLAINGKNNKAINSYIGDFKNSLWGYCKVQMKPLLIERGFKVQDVSSTAGVFISW